MSKWNMAPDPIRSRRGAVRAPSVAWLRVVDGVDDDGAAAGDGAGRETHLRAAPQRQRQGGAQEPQGEVSEEDTGWPIQGSAKRWSPGCVNAAGKERKER